MATSADREDIENMDTGLLSDALSRMDLDSTAFDRIMSNIVWHPHLYQTCHVCLITDKWLQSIRKAFAFQKTKTSSCKQSAEVDKLLEYVRSLTNHVHDMALKSGKLKNKSVCDFCLHKTDYIRFYVILIEESDVKFEEDLDVSFTRQRLFGEIFMIYKYFIREVLCKETEYTKPSDEHWLKCLRTNFYLSQRKGNLQIRQPFGNPSEKNGTPESHNIQAHSETISVKGTLTYLGSSTTLSHHRESRNMIERQVNFVIDNEKKKTPSKPVAQKRRGKINLMEEDIAIVEKHIDFIHECVDEVMCILAYRIAIAFGGAVFVDGRRKTYSFQTALKFTTLDIAKRLCLLTSVCKACFIDSVFLYQLHEKLPYFEYEFSWNMTVAKKNIVDLLLKMDLVTLILSCRDALRRVLLEASDTDECYNCAVLKGEPMFSTKTIRDPNGFLEDVHSCLRDLFLSNCL